LNKVITKANLFCITHIHSFRIWTGIFQQAISIYFYKNFPGC